MSGLTVVGVLRDVSEWFIVLLACYNPMVRVSSRRLDLNPTRNSLGRCVAR